MSLRVIHVFVILVSSAALLFFGVWSFQQFALTHLVSHLYWGGASSFLGIILVPYLFWFFSKTKEILSQK